MRRRLCVAPISVNGTAIGKATSVVSAAARTRVADLYGAYRPWAEARGEEPLASNALGERLEERGYRVERGTGGRRYRVGLGLRREREP